MRWLVFLSLVFSGCDWCERNLIGPDPYQFERLSPDKLVTVYFELKNSKADMRVIDAEIRQRLKRGELSYEDREILSKTIGGVGPERR